MAGRMPNILFVQTDQLTIDVLNAYHRPLALTPAIDRLAADGVVFDTFYCNVPLCAPSRASMMTGMLGSRIGAFDNGTELPASVPTYAHYLRQAGYYTSLCGKMHFIGPDQLHGFETRRTTDIYPGDFAWTPDWSQSGFHGATDSRVLTDSGVCARSVQLDYDDDVTHQAVQEIFDCARRDDGRPFFLQVSYTHPHDPYLCRQYHWDRYEDSDIPPPQVDMPAPEDNDPHSLRLLAQHGFDRADVPPEAVLRTRRAYCGSVSYIDDQLARLVAALEDSGQRDNTVIVFTSDHGEMLGERGMWLKKSFFEPSARVPLIISAPDRFAPGRVATPPEDNDPHSLRLLAQHGFDRADVPPEAVLRTRRAYCGSVSYIDDQLARLVAALEDSGQRDNTVIVFTSDHGEMLGERGMWQSGKPFSKLTRGVSQTSQVMSIVNRDMASALPELQMRSHCAAGMRLPRMIPLRSPRPRATVCVPGGS